MEHRCIGRKMKENGQEISYVTDIVRRMKNRFILWKMTKNRESESAEEDTVKNRCIGRKMKKNRAKESAEEDKVKIRCIGWKMEIRAKESEKEDKLKNCCIEWKMEKIRAKESAKEDKLKNCCIGWKMEKIRAKESAREDNMDLPIDRISALPEDLLLHILSYLDVKDAAITSVLSKTWQFLWRDMPRLVFKERGRFRGDPFLKSVHAALAVRGSNHLEKFEVEFRYPRRELAYDFDAWIQFCVNRKVEDVSLMPLSTGEEYTLPQMIYSNSWLKCLKLRDFIISPRTTIQWRSLTKLHLVRMPLGQHLFGKILSGCPVLSDFIIQWCWGIYRLEVHSQSLHRLAIIEWVSELRGVELEISAPYIRRLEITEWAYGAGSLRLANISSLASVYIRFGGGDDGRKTKEVFGSIEQIRKSDLKPSFLTFSN